MKQRLEDVFLDSFEWTMNANSFWSGQLRTLIWMLGMVTVVLGPIALVLWAFGFDTLAISLMIGGWFGVLGSRIATALMERFTRRGSDA